MIKYIVTVFIALQLIFSVGFTQTQLNNLTGILIGEGGRSTHSLVTLSCTVRNRILSKWNKNKVILGYHARYVKPTKKEIDLVHFILTNETASDFCGEEYYALSNSDRFYLGIQNVQPLIIKCAKTNKTKCIFFYKKGDIKW